MAEKQNGELATEDNVKPLVEKAFQTLISDHKEILLEALNRLEKTYQSCSPEIMPVYQVVLADVRKIIIAAKK